MMFNLAAVKCDYICMTVCDLKYLSWCAVCMSCLREVCAPCDANKDVTRTSVGHFGLSLCKICLDPISYLAFNIDTHMYI